MSRVVIASGQDNPTAPDADRIADRVVFIGGSPRSGTTLVQNMLDCHPQVLGGPEFLHLPDIFELRRKLLISVNKEWIDLICSRADVDRQIQALVANLLLPFADRHGARMLSEKTPENVLVFPDLLELLPRVRLIHVVRDPRATIASLLSVGNRARTKDETPAPFTANLSAAVQQVRKCLEAGFRASAAAPGRVLTVVYERLAREPETVGRELCAFLDLEWDPAMATPGAKAHLGEAAITTNSKEIWYDASTYNSNPYTDSVDKWRDTLTPADLLTIERAFARSEGLRALGYDLAPAHLTRVERISGTFGRISHEARGKASRALHRVFG